MERWDAIIWTISDGSLMSLETGAVYPRNLPKVWRALRWLGGASVRPNLESSHGVSPVI